MRIPVLEKKKLYIMAKLYIIITMLLELRISTLRRAFTTFYLLKPRLIQNK